MNIRKIEHNGTVIVIVEACGVSPKLNKKPKKI